MVPRQELQVPFISQVMVSSALDPSGRNCLDFLNPGLIAS